MFEPLFVVAFEEILDGDNQNEGNDSDDTGFRWHCHFRKRPSRPVTNLLKIVVEYGQTKQK